VEVRRAGPDELPVVVEILEGSTAWLGARGVGGWYPGQFREEVAGEGRLVQAHREGDVYLAWEGGRVVGTITLQWSDPLFWPGTPPDAGYVHRLAVAGDAHGRGVGRALLAWAARQALDRGKRYLRLDTVAENPAIRRYYEQAGFEARGDLVVGPWSVALYEKRICP
jgi:GNAT superfamily N-acetyltransferase